MERTPIETPLPLAEAQFVDRLDPAHEDQWQELVAGIPVEPRLTMTSVAMKLWENEAAPQVFRDRAMLLAVGTDEYWQQNGPVHRRFLGAYGETEAFFRGLRPEEAAGRAFTEWYWRALDYQTKHEVNLIDNKVLFNQAQHLYKADYFDAQTLGYALDFIDTDTIFACDRDIESDPLDPNRSRLLADTLSTFVNAHDEPMRAWAAAMVSWRLQAEATGAHMPAWLQAVTQEQLVSLCEQVLSLTRREGGFAGARLRLPVEEKLPFIDAMPDTSSWLSFSTAQEVYEELPDDERHLNIARRAAQVQHDRRVESDPEAPIRPLDEQVVTYIGQIMAQLEEPFASYCAEELAQHERAAVEQAERFRRASADRASSEAAVEAIQARRDGEVETFLQRLESLK